MTLKWYRAASADIGHNDEETDLAAVGNPKGASWAYVAEEGDGWCWAILDGWLWHDPETGADVGILASGTETNRETAKAAVASWVAAPFIHKDN